MSMVSYPLTSLHFEVSWGDSQNTSSFSEVSGLTMEAEVVEYRGGADKALSTRKMPGLKKFGDVTLKRGIVPAEAGNGFFEWYNSIVAGSVIRRDVTISLLNEERTPVMTWKVQGAWPIKVEGPAFKSTGTDTAIETLVFACEHVTTEVP
jgi:phage tail-like protein